MLFSLLFFSTGIATSNQLFETTSNQPFETTNNPPFKQPVNNHFKGRQVS